MNSSSSVKLHGPETVFTDLSVTDSVCSEPYLPTCIFARAVKRAIGFQPPVSLVNKFLDDVEKTDLRRITRSQFEYFCASCEIAVADASATDARNAAKSVFRGKQSLTVEEFREQLQRSTATEPLSQAEMDKIVSAVESQAPVDVPSDNPPSSSPLGRTTSSGKLVTCDALEQFLKQGSATDVRGQNTQQQQTAADFGRLGSDHSSNGGLVGGGEGFGVVSNDSQLLHSDEFNSNNPTKSGVATSVEVPWTSNVSVVISEPSRPPSRINELPNDSVVRVSPQHSYNNNTRDVIVSPVSAPPATMSRSVSPQPQNEQSPPPPVIQKSKEETEKSKCCTIM